MDLEELLTLALAADGPAAGQARIAALAAALAQAPSPDTDLAALEAGAVAQFEELYGDGQGYNPADAPTLEALADVADAVRLVRADRAALAGRVTAMADRVRTAPVVVEAPEPDLTVAGGVVAATTDPAATAGPGSAAPSPAEIAAEATAPAAALATTTARPSTAAVVVAAGGGAVPAVSPAGEVAPWRRYVITASAEVPNIASGANLSMTELAAAAGARYGTFPSGQPTGSMYKANVGLVHREFDPEHRLSGDYGDLAALDRVADERRLAGGSLLVAQRALTAAAAAPGVYNDVWCTPSQTDYTLCPALATAEGMIDLPTTGMPSRGGIRYPVWTQYPEQQVDSARNGWHGTVVTYPDPPADPGVGLDNPTYFHRDAADVPPGTGLGNLKRCIKGPCVAWRDTRASVAYLCVTSDLLRDRTFPEGLERFLSEVLVHHQHWLNEMKIAYLQAHGDPIPPFSVQAGSGAIGSTSLTAVDRLSLLVTWMRNRYKMALRATLEIIAPEWFREYLKRDIEKRQSRTTGAVSDGEIADLFAAYASRVQWVRDWQELGDGVAVGGRIMPPGGWPSSVNMMAYPAGSWVYSEGNILTLGVQYDPLQLESNEYSAMFTEDSWMLLNRCNRTFVVSLTDLCANGAVGPNRDSCLMVTTLLPGPSGLSAGTPTATTAPLVWTAVPGAVGYQVQRSVNAGATWTDVVTGSGGTPTAAFTTVTGLTTATAYHFRVIAVNVDGVRGAPSAAIPVTTT
jgi:hypothetical protein